MVAAVGLRNAGLLGVADKAALGMGASRGACKCFSRHCRQVKRLKDLGRQEDRAQDELMGS